MFGFLWRDTSGIPSNIQVGHTIYGDLVAGANRSWSNADDCSIRVWQEAGYYYLSEDTFPFHLYANSKLVADTIKWWLRNYVASLGERGKVKHCIPIFRSFEEYFKQKVDAQLERMDVRTEKFIIQNRNNVFIPFNLAIQQQAKADLKLTSEEIENNKMR